MKLLVAAALVLVLQSADGAARPKGLLTKHVRNGVLSLVQPLIRPTVTVPGVPDGYTDESSADFVPSLPGYGALDGKLDFGLYAGCEDHGPSFPCDDTITWCLDVRSRKWTKRHCLQHSQPMCKVM